MTYKMAVANLQGLVDTIANFTRTGLPGSVSQLSAEQVVVSERTGVVVKVHSAATYGILWPVLRVTVFPEDIVKLWLEMEEKMVQESVQSSTGGERLLNMQSPHRPACWALHTIQDGIV